MKNKAGFMGAFFLPHVDFNRFYYPTTRWSKPRGVLAPNRSLFVVTASFLSFQAPPSLSRSSQLRSAPWYGLHHNHTQLPGASEWRAPKRRAFGFALLHRQHKNCFVVGESPNSLSLHPGVTKDLFCSKQVGRTCHETNKSLLAMCTITMNYNGEN